MTRPEGGWRASAGNREFSAIPAAPAIIGATPRRPWAARHRVDRNRSAYRNVSSSRNKHAPPHQVATPQLPHRRAVPPQHRLVRVFGRRRRPLGAWSVLRPEELRPLRRPALPAVLL